MRRSNAHRDRVLSGVPAGVEDLLVEVERVHRHGVAQRAAVFQPWLVARKRTADLLRLESRLVRLKNDVGQRIRIVYPKVVVIRSGENVSAVLYISHPLEVL